MLAFRRCLERFDSSERAMLRLLNDILDFSRIEAGQMRELDRALGTWAGASTFAAEDPPVRLPGQGFEASKITVNKSARRLHLRQRYRLARAEHYVHAFRRYTR